MQLETLHLFQELLNNLQLSVGASDFDEVAQRVITAKVEVLAEIAASEET